MRSPKWMLGASGVPSDSSGRDEVRPASNLQCRIRAVHYAGGQPHGSRPDPWDMHAQAVINPSRFPMHRHSSTASSSRTPAPRRGAVARYSARRRLPVRAPRRAAASIVRTIAASSVQYLPDQPIVGTEIRRLQTLEGSSQFDEVVLCGVRKHTERAKDRTMFRLAASRRPSRSSISSASAASSTASAMASRSPSSSAVRSSASSCRGD